MEIKAEKINKVYGTIVVLEDISFSLERGQKVGLVGENGTGKSTLLKILAGIIEPDGGNITARDGLIVGYMPQDTSLVTDETVYDYLFRISGINKLEKHRLDTTLAGLGLPGLSNDQPINSLSSGQKSKVFMAGVLLSNPDVLLLDEPTNNLDLPSLIWLENFLMQSELTCIIVSHDRFFLDRVVQKIFEIDWQTRTLIITGGKFSDYLIRKEKERARQLAEHENQQEEIKRLKESAREKKIKAIQGSHYEGSDHDTFLRGFRRDQAARSGKTAKTIEKRIERIDVVEKPTERNVFRIHLRPVKPKGPREIVLKNAVVGYADSKYKIGPLSLTISFGSRIAILGLNGSGKSTLLKAINGKLDVFSGDITVGNGLVVGNLMQEHDNLPREKSLKSFLVERAGITIQEAYNLAVKYGFKASEIDKEIVNLSPGGRARLLFALFSALSVNVLLLDEPTNHLDLEALSALEEAVTHYKGTIVLVSHDRYFLEKFCATDTYVLSDGILTEIPDYKTYVKSVEEKARKLLKYR